MIAIPILLSLSLLVVDFYINRKIYSPGIVFNGITFLTLFLYSFQLSDIQQTLSERTVLLLTMCVMWFNIPVYIGYAIKIKKNTNLYNQSTKQYAPIELQQHKPVTKLDIIFLTVVLSIFVLEVVYNKGFPLLWRLMKNGKTYVDFGMPGLRIHPFFIALLMLGGEYSIFRKKCYFKWIYLLIPILMVSRAPLLAIIVEGFVVYIVSVQKKPKYFWVYLSVAVLVGIALFGIIGNFRTGKGEFLAVAQFKPFTKWIPSSIKWVYSYMCFSVSNLNNLVSMTPGFVNYGASSMNQIFHSFINIPENKSFYFLVSPNFTVSTFVPTLYLDFGIFGPVIFCMLIGILGVLIYRLIELSEGKKIGYILLYGFYVYAVSCLYFVNMFFEPIILQTFFILIFFIIPNWIQRRKNK